MEGFFIPKNPPPYTLILFSLPPYPTSPQKHFLVLLLNKGLLNVKNSLTDQKKVLF